jgi:hypothetical protein
MSSMKKYIILLLAITTLFACKKSKSDDETCEYVCVAHHYKLNFRLVDKTTGAELVFGANPRYNAADIKLFIDAAGTHPIPLNTNTTVKSFETFMGKQTMYLKAGATTYKLDATYRFYDCCASIAETLKIDGVSICTHCDEIINVPVN